MTHIPPVLQPLNWLPPTYVSPAELQRRERVAVGRICRCGKCVCCEELRRESVRVNMLTPNRRC